jgi:hypothetical protein
VSIKTLIFETKKDGDIKHPKNDPLICDISNDLDKDHTLVCAFSFKMVRFIVSPAPALCRPDFCADFETRRRNKKIDWSRALKAA